MKKFNRFLVQLWSNTTFTFRLSYLIWRKLVLNIELPYWVCFSDLNKNNLSKAFFDVLSCNIYE